MVADLKLGVAGQGGHQRSLVAGFFAGLAYTNRGFQHQEDVISSVFDPGHDFGYLFRVGKSRVRPRKTRALFVRDNDESLWFEPALGTFLAELPERQRTAVVLVHGYGWTSAEVAAMTGIKATTVQSHVERGLARLRALLEVEKAERD